MVSGFFGAGAADQFNKQQELDTAESRVRNQAEQFRTTNALNLLQNARDRLEKVTQLGALPQFANAPSFQGVIEGQRGNVVRAAQLAGITDENQLMAMIRTSSALGQGAVPLKAFEERQTAAAGVIGRVGGAEEAAGPLSPDERKTRAGALPPKGTTVNVNTNFPDLLGRNKQESAKTRDDLAKIPGLMTKAQEALKSIKASPTAAGVSGNIIESALGVAQNLGNLVGLDIKPQFQKDFDKARNDARLLTAELISIVTGETGRFTDKERAIAQETQRTLSADSSGQQVVNALNNMIPVLQADRRRTVNKAIVQGNIDLSTPEGRDKLRKVLESTGFDLESAVEAVLEQLKARGIEF